MDGRRGDALTTLAPYVRSEGFGINAAQQVVGYSADSGFNQMQAVLWNGTVPTSLGSLPGHAFTQANAINSAGAIVGFAKSSESDPDGNAFIWRNGQMLDLNSLIAAMSGWHLTSAMDINDTGAIVGYGTLNGAGEVVR